MIQRTGGRKGTPVTIRLPNEDVLAKLGKIALLNGHLENQLRMLVGIFASTTKIEALDAPLIRVLAR